MLKIRIIPTLLWKDFGLVKGIGFNSWRRLGLVLPAVKIYNARQVDELILLDIAATPDGKEPDYDAISDFASCCFVPLTIGGGIRSLDHAKQLLRSGADKVCVNTAAYENPDLIKEISSYFGAQSVVVSIDVEKNSEGNYICYSHCGQHDTGIKVNDWAKKMESKGAGEIMISSIKHDGALKGYDLELIKLVTSSVNIPVIASGGASAGEDFYKAINEGLASAVAAASIFHFTEQTPLLIKQYLHEKGIPVRGFKFK